MKQARAKFNGKAFDMYYDVDKTFGGAEWEAVAQWCVNNVAPGDVFLDVGAYIGFMSVAVLRHSSPYAVIALEPDPQTFEILKKNLSLYETALPLCLAAGDMNGSHRMYVKEDNPAQNSLYDRRDLDGKKIINVPTATIDRVLESGSEDIGSIVMKIDVEFAEHLVWAGMQKTLPRVKAFCMEYQPVFFKKITGLNPNDLVDSIKAVGFRDEQLTNNNLAFYRV